MPGARQECAALCRTLAIFQQQAIELVAQQHFLLAERGRRTGFQILRQRSIGALDPGVQVRCFRCVQHPVERRENGEAFGDGAGVAVDGCGQSLQQVIGADPARAEAGDQRVGKHDLFASRQAVKAGDEAGEISGIGVEAPIACAARIRHHPVRAIAIKRDFGNRLGQHLADRAVAYRPVQAGSEGHVPDLRVRFNVGAKRRVALLGDRDQARVRGRTGHGHIQRWNAGLADIAGEGVHHVRLARAVSEALHEIVRIGDTVLEAAHVQANAFAERLFAEIGLEHVQHTAALAIGDGVERIENVTIGIDWIADLARRLKAVSAHRAEPGQDRAETPFAVRVDTVHRLVADPGREGFVQPDIVPPFRRDEIAEPLMAQLVGMCRQDAAAARQAGLLIHQEGGFAIDDCAGILHRTIGKFRRGDQVEFSIRVRIVEIGFLPEQHLVGDVERLAELLFLAARRKTAQGYGRRAQGIGRNGRGGPRLVRADREGDQIGLDRACFGKDMPAPAILGGLGADLCGIGNDLHAVWRGDGDAPRRLEARLVERGHHAARINRFHLGGEIVRVGLDGLVEPGEAQIVGRGVADFERRRAGRDRRVEIEPGDAARRLVAGEGGRDFRAIVQHGLGAENVLLHRMQPDARMRCGQRHVDRHRAGEAFGVRIGLQVQPVGKWGHIGRQLACRGHL